MKSQNENINCLLVYPEFSQFSFWNTKEAIQTSGAKACNPPLGLLTVAALLPRHWNFRLMDLNVGKFDEESWQWADLVCTGGMLPQQVGLLTIINKANQDGKFVCAGGPDPTSQPEIYSNADALVLNEGEVTIPIWLHSWSQGKPAGIFSSEQKADMTKSPPPRYDLIDINDYYYMGIQYARGCPFNCEFCDIIELYGRKPRQKTVSQFMVELDQLYSQGFRGYIEIVDDNFIGNKPNVSRELLPRLIEWQAGHRHPFYFGTEATINAADDDKLLRLMRDAGFKSVFIGIESPDPELLVQTQKSFNATRPIVERVQRFYEYGIMVHAGFIMGFDNEKPNTDQAILKCIEDTGICMSMIGLLVALPNTQLTRRLISEKRLINMKGKIIDIPELALEQYESDLSTHVIDQTQAGLNFITTRDRLEILNEYANAVRQAYDPRRYFDRALRTARMMKYRAPRTQGWWEMKRSIRSLVVMAWKMTLNSTTRRLYWRNVILGMGLGLHRFEVVLTLSSVYLHFHKQSNYLLGVLDEQIRRQARLPRQIGSGDMAGFVLEVNSKR
jgi:radical SAM superfamily enzyme YgiQ (UPF0313 family)